MVRFLSSRLGAWNTTKTMKDHRQLEKFDSDYDRGNLERVESIDMNRQNSKMRIAAARRRTGYPRPNRRYADARLEMP